MNVHALTDHQLALLLTLSEHHLDFDAVLECENEIAGRLRLHPDETEQGLTPHAAARIDDFLADHT